MKNKRKLNNLLLIFLLIIYSFVFFIEKSHDCEGEGCLICISFICIKFVSNVFLLITFIPLVIEKVNLILNNYCHTNSDLNRFTICNKDNRTYNPINNKEVILDKFCIALK